MVSYGSDLSYSAEQVALQTSIATFCERSGLGPLYTVHEALPDGFWPGLAEIGVLGLGTEQVGGGPLEIAAAMETLGSFGAPGPLVGTFTAGALLDADEMSPFASGEAMVSVGDGSIYPWAPRAARSSNSVMPRPGWWSPGRSPTSTRRRANRGVGSGEPARGRWGRRSEPALSPRLRSRRSSSVPGASCCRDTVDYAHERKQFGKPIATFQAVSHPIAQASIRLTASQILCRGAAQRLDDDAGSACSATATARVSAVGSATATAYLAHQVFGAMGFTLEGPVAHLSHRIRQVGMLPPRLADSRERVLADLTTTTTSTEGAPR